MLEPLGIDSGVARIVTSELATNAVRHAHTPFRVAVTVQPGKIRLEVEDGAGAQKIATEMASDRTGRGLLIVESAATSWGVEHRGEKKAVWVELQHSARQTAESPAFIATQILPRFSDLRNGYEVPSIQA